MSQRTMVSLLSVLLLVSIIVALASPGTVMAAVGLTDSRGGFFEKVETRTLNTIKSGLEELAKKMGKSDSMTYSSDDGVADVNVQKENKAISVSIAINGNKLSEATCKDYGKVSNLAKEYLKPVLGEKQTMGLCSLFFSDAYEKYRNGATKIELVKKQEGISIECFGDINSGKINVNIQSALAVKTSFMEKLRRLFFD